MFSTQNFVSFGKTGIEISVRFKNICIRIVQYLFYQLIPKCFFQYIVASFHFKYRSV